MNKVSENDERNAGRMHGRIRADEERRAANVQTGTHTGSCCRPTECTQHSNPSTTVKLNTNFSNQIVPWSVYSGYGYWKIHVINTSKSRMTVKNPQGFSDRRTGMCPMYIPAGGKLPFYGADGHSHRFLVHTIWIFPPMEHTL